MKKSVCLLLTLILLLSILGGCSSKKSGKSQSVKTLNMGIIYSDKDQGSVYKDIAKDYEKLNKDNIKVNIVTDYGDQDKIKASLTQTGAIDIIGMKRDALLDYSKQGVLHDLSTFVNDSGFTTKLYNISLAYGEYDGKNYGIGDLPMSMEWFYNPDLLSKYGLKEPANLDDLLKISKTIKSVGLIPVGLGAIDGFTVSSLFGMITASTTGSSELTNDFGSQMDTFKNINGMNSAFKIFGKLCGSAILTNSDEINYRQSVQDFVNGKSAFLPAGSFACSLINQIKPNGFNYKCLSSGIALSQNPISLYSVSGGQILTIAGNSKNTGEAEKFLKFLMSEDEQKKFTEKGYVSSLKSANSSQNEIGNNILNHIEASDMNSIMLMDNIDSTMLSSLEMVLKDELAGRVKPTDAWSKVLKSTYKQ